MSELFKGTPDVKYSDLHIHTNQSFDVHDKGMNSDEVVHLAEATGLAAIAVTDHHTVRAAHDAREYAASTNSKVEVVVGIEVDTKQGHILGLFVENPIEAKGFAGEAIEEIHRQGGLAIIPHPFMRLMRPDPAGMQLKDLQELLSSGVGIDGFEVYSQGAEDVAIARRKQDDTNKSNNLAQLAYEAFHESLGAAIASSDAHGLTLGRARTAYEGDLRTAIEKRTTIPVKLGREENMKILAAANILFGNQRLIESTSKLRRNLLNLNQETK